MDAATIHRIELVEDLEVYVNGRGDQGKVYRTSTDVWRGGGDQRRHIQ